MKRKCTVIPHGTPPVARILPAASRLVALSGDVIPTATQFTGQIIYLPVFPLASTGTVPGDRLPHVLIDQSSECFARVDCSVTLDTTAAGSYCIDTTAIAGVSGPR